MSTILIMVAYIVFGTVVRFPLGLAMNLAGVPGAMLGLGAEKAAPPRYWLGVLTSFAGQGFVYLAYVALVVKSTQNLGLREDLLVPAVWLCAFVISMGPVAFHMNISQREDKEMTAELIASGKTPHPANPQLMALRLTWAAALVGFLLFSFNPESMTSAWSWVPEFFSRKS